MPRRVFKYYQRKRVVNINLNILAAGFISIAIAKYPVFLIGEWIGPEQKFLISVIAYVLDTTIDVCMYYGLHWVANHWNPRGNLPKDNTLPKSRKFMQDATRVQAERLALVPIFMLVSMGGMWALQHFYDITHSWAFVFAFVAAMLVTRIVHTFWGYQSGTFKDHIDFMIDDQFQIGRDLTAEAEAKAQSESEPKPDATDEATR
jgi:hypothetical protein